MKFHLTPQQLEIPATLFGITDVYLVSRENVWNFFFGMITVSIYMVIFYQVKLYADMCLQGVFFGFQFYGLYHWLWGAKQQGKPGGALQIQWAPRSVLVGCGIAIVTLWALLAFILHRYTDSTLIWVDALTTAMSLTAQWLLSKKYLQNWLLWIAMDSISIVMYSVKHLYFTSFLYAVFLSICIKGFFAWRAKLDRTAAEQATPLTAFATAEHSQ